MADKNTLARPYAKAAFEYALSEGKLADWSAMLGLVAEAAGNEEVAQLLSNPSLGSQDKAEILLEICKAKIDDKGRNFILLLSEKDRLPLIPVIAEIYEAFKAEEQKSIEAEVTSAFDLNAEQQKLLVDALRKRLNREVTLKVVIDKRLIGGVIIRTGDLVIDGSIRGKLAKLAESLKS
ncbi:F-type H+-transporting ATPase subunit delta [Marinospirillum celere]|uniref:ATP synthase subunit delta n=1 Tax=Marinospirillum celere TaxID=1122252 RepID=A0A1I1IF03_9GAMM|nr:F0F1 ATP synthase subunit delta [Marinospirillum celere]SFC31790.1 F-type H+-transporting ATPase subunit delta [Marinospirillum celere]